MATSNAPQLIRFADCTPEPWANGGGVTRVVAKGWFDGGSADYHWRLSVADVSSSGAFSKLPGVDRVITLTDGPGLLLTIDGQQHTLEPFRPLAFTGEAATESEVTEPTRDFNVMTRRGVCTALVDVITGSETRAVPGDSITYVISLKGSAEVELAAGVVTLGQFDTLLLPAAGTIRVKADGRVVVVRIEPVIGGA
ncbi:HutD family protein [Mycolicibacterium sp. P9-64]|uniref:HutD/Ves family protein n=1 Tax=Mycolicibacterium sp. P9-64 TaxID=2024612 RepID=UPI0011F022F8|nr:HutD family protein [Mycolicibacterium sp. P9-64]KAA0077183.1 HutD family protein [Mycolicibacterium sp. P9-64]